MLPVTGHFWGSVPKHRNPKRQEYKNAEDQNVESELCRNYLYLIEAIRFKVEQRMEGAHKDSHMTQNTQNTQIPKVPQ